MRVPKKLLLTFCLGWLAGSLPAQTLPERYAQYGELILVKLDSAPFPHPDRAQGHAYQKQLYTAEKNYSDNSVAIFVPKGFRRTAKVDFVVHFHGWRHHIATTLPEYQLIEQFAESGRNAILIVPQGPYDAPDSFAGKMEDAGGFQRFMADVMKTLHERRVIGNSALGAIIISGHSGGYEALGSIVARGGISDHVREVWIFDALYARREQFSNWFTHYPERRLIDIYTAHGGTKEESENFMAWLKDQTPAVPFFFKNEPEVNEQDLRQNHLIFMFSELEHDQVVFKRHQFCQYLKTSGLASIKVRALASPKAAAE